METSNLAGDQTVQAWVQTLVTSGHEFFKHHWTRGESTEFTEMLTSMERQEDLFDHVKEHEAKHAKTALSVINASEGRQWSGSGRAGGRRCYVCNRQGHVKADCPDVRCSKCGRMGHLQWKCQAKIEARNSSMNKNEDGAYFVHVQSEDTLATRAMIDPGSMISMVRQDKLTAQGRSRMSENIDGPSIRGIGMAQPLGTLTTLVTIGGTTREQTFKVMRATDLPVPMVMGLDSLGNGGFIMDSRAMTMKFWDDNRQVRVNIEKVRGRDILGLTAMVDKMMKNSATEGESRRQYIELLTGFQDVFIAGGEMPKMARVPPQSIGVTRRPVVDNMRMWTKHQEELMESEVEKLEAAGIIQKSRSPWRSEPHLAPKGDGFRLCGDYRRVNAETEFDAYPMPTFEREIHKVADAQWITKLDLAQSFLQVPLDEESRPKTAFRGPNGLYEYTRLPYGLKNSSAIFARLINETVMQKLSKNTREHTIAYIDDLVVGSRTIEEHFEMLRELFEVLRVTGWQVKASKVIVAARQLEALGHIVGMGQLRPIQFKMEAINALTPSLGVRELRSFLATASHYRRYVPKMADVCTPLYQLTKKGVPFIYDERHRQAEREIKDMLLTSPILQLFREDKEVTLSVDASMKGLGAVIEQEGRPVAFASRRLNAAEEKYSPTDKELLAIVWGLEYFRRWTLGRHVHVFSDHQSLERTEKLKANDPTGRTFFSRI